MRNVELLLTLDCEAGYSPAWQGLFLLHSQYSILESYTVHFSYVCSSLSTGAVLPQLLSIRHSWM